MKFVFLGIIPLIFFSCNSSIQQVEKLEFVLLEERVQFTESDLQSSELGLYSSLPNRYGGAQLLLKKDNKFSFARSGCRGGSIDSGYYKIIKDTLHFSSGMGDAGSQLVNTRSTKANQSPPPPPPYFSKIANVESFVIQNHKFYSTLDSGLILFKKGIEHFIVKNKNADGSIEGEKIGIECKIVEEGEFKDSILYNGNRYKYLNDYNEMATIFRIEDFKITDSFPDNLIY